MNERCTECGLRIVEGLSLLTGVCAVCRHGLVASRYAGAWQWSACTDPCEFVGRELFQSSNWSGWADPRNACTAQQAIAGVPRPAPWCMCGAQRLTHRRTPACAPEAT